MTLFDVRFATTKSRQRGFEECFGALRGDFTAGTRSGNWCGRMYKRRRFDERGWDFDGHLQYRWKYVQMVDLDGRPNESKRNENRVFFW